MAAQGTPLAELVVVSDGAQDARSWNVGPTTDDSAGAGAALSHRAGLRRGAVEHGQSLMMVIGVSRMTVGKWRSRFVATASMVSTTNLVGGPRSIGDDDVERVIVRCRRRDCGCYALVDSLDGSGGSRNRRSVGSGGPSGSSRIWSTPSSCHRTRCSSTRSVTSSGSTSTRPRPRWCCASTRRHRSKRSTAPLQSCR